MKETIIYCDICGKKNATTCHFYIDRKMDGAGSMEDQHESLDLCDEHKWTAYQKAEKIGGRQLGAQVFQQMAALLPTKISSRMTKQMDTLFQQGEPKNV